MDTATVFRDKMLLSGLLVATIEAEHMDRVRLDGVRIVEDTGDQIVVERPNGVVTTGLQLALDRLFGLNGPPAALSHLYASADDQTVTLATTNIDPAGGATGFAAKAFTENSRSGTTVTAGALFTQADIAFIVRKVGLGNTATDAGTGLYNVVGGAGGVSPFARTLSIDLTNAGDFNLTLKLQVTAANKP